MFCSSTVERLLKAFIRHLYCTLVASVIPMLSCHYLCWLINHIAVYSIVTRESVTTPMLIYINQCSKLQIPMFSFISLQTSTLQHSVSTKDIIKASATKKETNTSTYIQEMQQCSELQQIGIVTVAHFSMLCFTVPMHYPCGL